MQGKYEEAADRYTRALELKPEWEDATINRKIALARAEMLKKEGGDMTGGKLEAGSDASDVRFFPIDELPSPFAFPTDRLICEKLRRCLVADDLPGWLDSCG